MKISNLLLTGVVAAFGQTLDVCEVLKNLSALKGKSIIVQGVWVQSHASGEYLLSEESCGQMTIQGGWQFWDAIQLVDEHGASKGRFLAASAKSKAPVKTIATFTGRVETREHFEVETLPSGERRPRAFGHSAARLVVSGKAREIVHVPWKEDESARWAERWKNCDPKHVESGQ